MRFRYDSYCGIYCGACGVINAIKNGNFEELAKKHNRKPEELECYGCKITAAGKKNKCRIIACAVNKGVEFCFECDEYPCDMLKKFKEDEYPYHSLIFKNSERIKEIGIGQWSSEQEKRWNCPACGKHFSWHDEKCTACSAKLYNCKDEQRDL
jgi:hypothetical protein